MTIVIKGRHTVRASTPAGRTPRYIEPWIFVPKPNSILAKLERAYLDALEAVDQIEMHKTEASNSGTFTPEGILSNALSFAASTLAPRLKRARTTVEQARHEAATLRAKLALKVDKTDVYGLTRRAELRAWLRSLPENERRAISANIDSIDPELRLAITEMPSALSGVLQTDRQQLLDRALLAEHGEAINELRELETAIAITEDVAQKAREEIAQDCGGGTRFYEAARPFEQRATAPWLKKFTENGEEVVRAFRLGKERTGNTLDERMAAFPVFAVPTPEELETGVFYTDIHEWRRAQGLPPATQEKGNGAAV
jgi:hypothetical protein